MRIKKIFKRHYVDLFIILLGLSSGIILMFSTFSVENNKLLIATKAWSDFASHIPLIRSFSLGFNFPPQYPLFPGEPIKYHFLFYSIVGLLEKMGLRIDLALNIISTVGFTALVILIYAFAKEIFKSKMVGLISVIFFLFNSSLSFIYFFKNHPLSGQTINQIISNKDFLSFAPYGSGIISAFWNLNIYTNQRHLALSFALSLGLIYLLIKLVNGKAKLSIKVSVCLGIILGLSFYLHIAVFLMTVIIIFSFGIFFKEIRKNSFLILLPTALIAFPQYKYLTSSAGYQMHVLIGYLASTNLTINKFIEFWVYNLGLSFLLIPLGFIIASKFQRKILLSFLTLFLVGNLIQFSPEIAANHKFFNYFLLIGNMFSAYVLVKFWDKRLIFKPIVIVIFLFMIWGGIIDLFPILNDRKIAIADYKINREAMWILENTPKESVFLNSTFLYNPASLAGRKIFLGWPYFAWSQGYDTDKRFGQMKQMLGSEDKQTACSLLKQNKIDYVEIQIQNPPDPNSPAISNLYLQSFFYIYQDKVNNYYLYSVKKTCEY